MTRREKILAIVLTSLLVVFGGGILFHFFVYQPISDTRTQLSLAQEQLAKKQEELSQEEQQIQSVLDVNPRLEHWRKISLPSVDATQKKAGVPSDELKRRHLAQLQVKYELFLSELLRSSGFKTDSIVISPRQPDRRTNLVVAKGQEPLYERLAFTVTGKGNKDNVVRMLRDFHKTNLLHQIRSIKLNTPSGASASGSSRRGSTPDGSLDLDMTVEALVVRGAEERGNLTSSTLTYTPQVLAPSRDYNQMGKRNMFVGIKPPPPPVVETPRVTEDRADVLRFIKLTTIFFNPERKRWEATIYDQATGPRRVEEQDDDGNRLAKVIWEKQLNTRVLRDLVIPDRYGNTILEAKVAHIDEGQVVLQAGKQFFRLRCGDALYPAIEKPLEKEELDKLGLKVVEEEEDEAP